MTRKRDRLCQHGIDLRTRDDALQGVETLRRERRRQGGCLMV
jgi:hypothetical protein